MLMLDLGKIKFSFGSSGSGSSSDSYDISSTTVASLGFSTSAISSKERS
jgi:hypothetical protein